jgi:hypothetical protein
MIMLGTTQHDIAFSPPPSRGRVREGGCREKFGKAGRECKKGLPSGSASRIDLPLKGEVKIND